MVTYKQDYFSGNPDYRFQCPVGRVLLTIFNQEERR